MLPLDECSGSLRILQLQIRILKSSQGKQHRSKLLKLKRLRVNEQTRPTGPKPGALPEKWPSLQLTSPFARVSVIELEFIRCSVFGSRHCYPVSPKDLRVAIDFLLAATFTI
jgi:hypothetical protein